MKHFGKKVRLDGYTFDSKKEAQFYLEFIKPSGFKYEVHPRYRYADRKPKDGGYMVSKFYTPDFVVYDKQGNIMHMYDVKTSISQAGWTDGAKANIYWYQRFSKPTIEIVVPRQHDFKMTFYGVSSKHNLDKHAKRRQDGSLKITQAGNVTYDYYNVYNDIDYRIDDYIGG